jgi:type IV pilus assembly protein PilO
MDALLSDINQAGLGRGVQFELLKPRQVSIKDYYAELPIDIKVVGTYHAIGGFASDIANLSRIVTLNDMRLSVGKDGLLVLDAVIKTFRYLDAGELLLRQKVEIKGSKE